MLNPNDPLVTYDPSNPPATPPYGQIGKWVRTKVLNWNSDRYKAYIYKNIRIRVMFPKNWDPTRQYPMITYIHGGGGKGNIYNNEAQLRAGTQLSKVLHDAILNDEFDGFALFPQSFGIFSEDEMQFLTEFIEHMIDEEYVDPFKLNFIGTSNGGKGCWNYIMNYPELIASAVPASGLPASSADNLIENVKHIPYSVPSRGAR